MLKKGLVVYATLVFLFFILIAMSAFTVVELSKAITTHNREEALVTLQSDFALSGTYQLVELNPSIGDDDSRVISLAYGRDATRSDTFDDIEERLTAKGFTLTDSRSPDTVEREDVYKNAAGDNVTVWIVTDQWRDSFTYGTELPEADSKAATEQAPVYVMMNVQFEDD